MPDSQDPTDSSTTVGVGSGSSSQVFRTIAAAGTGDIPAPRISPRGSLITWVAIAAAALVLLIGTLVAFFF
jgi:hypothetical protein